MNVSKEEGYESIYSVVFTQQEADLKTTLPSAEPYKELQRTFLFMVHLPGYKTMIQYERVPLTPLTLTHCRPSEMFTSSVLLILCL